MRYYARLLSICGGRLPLSHTLVCHSPDVRLPCKYPQALQNCHRVLQKEVSGCTDLPAEGQIPGTATEIHGNVAARSKGQWQGSFPRIARSRKGAVCHSRICCCHTSAHQHSIFDDTAARADDRQSASSTPACICMAIHLQTWHVLQQSQVQRGQSAVQPCGAWRRRQHIGKESKVMVFTAELAGNTAGSASSSP